MYEELASAEKVEPHSTFSTDASLPCILSILFYARKANKINKRKIMRQWKSSLTVNPLSLALSAKRFEPHDEVIYVSRL